MYNVIHPHRAVLLLRSWERFLRPLQAVQIRISKNSVEVQGAFTKGKSSQERPL